MKEIIREALKSFVAEKNILLMQKNIVNNCSEIIIEVSLLEKSRKAFSSSSSFVFSVVIKLHADVKKKIK